MILTAQEKHIESIHSLLQACGLHLRKNGVAQWLSSYPDLATVEADVAAGEAFVWIENDQLIGCITLNEQQDPQYAHIDWQWNSDKVLVVHRLGVSPVYQGQGQAKLLMDFAEVLARKNGLQVIRLDAYSVNPRSQAFYLKCGYRMTKKQLQFAYQQFPCNCFEKCIAKKTGH